MHSLSSKVCRSIQLSRVELKYDSSSRRPQPNMTDLSSTIDKTLPQSQTTIQRRSLMTTTRPSESLFDRLNYDVLDVIMNHIHLQAPEDLLKLCLVSKRLYMATVPWIYRYVAVKLSDGSSLQVLERITKENSKIAGCVWTLELKGCAEAPEDAWLPSRQCICQLTALREVIWNGYLNMPQSLIDVILSNCPKTTIEIKGRQVYYGGIGDETAPPVNIFNGLSLMQLTNFTFRPPTLDHLYRNFKRDLLNLLGNAPALRELEIYRGPVEEGTRIFPEMLSHAVFIKGNLPRLHKLRLYTWSIIFSDAELSVWGKHGGWMKLTQLVCPRPSNLQGFMHKSPALECLDLIMYTTEAMKDLEESIEEYEDNPFGPIKHLRYIHLITDDDPPEEKEHIMPWCILHRIGETLVYFESSDTTIGTMLPRPAAPTAIDLFKLRMACPKLEELSVDVVVTDPRWPDSLLLEICRFRKLMKLSLWLYEPLARGHHLQNLEFDAHGVLELTSLAQPLRPYTNSFLLSGKESYAQAFKYMVAMRQYYKVSTPMFQASFKRVREIFERELPERWFLADCVYTACSTRGIITVDEPYIACEKQYAERQKRELYSRMTSDELKKLLEPRHRVPVLTCLQNHQTSTDDVDMILEEIEYRDRKDNGIVQDTLYARWMETLTMES